MKQTQFRQGDVLIERVTKLPAGAKKIPATNGRHILAFGEKTLHHHSICESECEAYEESGVTYIEIQQALAMLTHQEHSAVEIPMGVYRKVQQREYSPEAIRNVAD